MVKMYQFVITGMPRSGTTFVADLLTQGGVVCNHELYYGMPASSIMRENAVAEASWLALPHLDRDKALHGYKVIHLLRNPLRVVSSLVQMGLLEDDQFATNPYTIYADKTVSVRHLSGLDRYLHFCIHWNLQVEKRADGHVQLEWASEHPVEFLKEFGVEAPEGIDIRPKNVWGSVNRLVLGDLDGCALKDGFIEFSRSCGYDLTEE